MIDIQKGSTTLPSKVLWKNPYSLINNSINRLYYTTRKAICQVNLQNFLKK